MFLRGQQKYHCVLDDRIKNYSTMQYSLRKVKNHTGPSFLPSSVPHLFSFLSIFLSVLKSFLFHSYLFLCVYTHSHAHTAECTWGLEDLLAEVCSCLSPRGPQGANSSISFGSWPIYPLSHPMDSLISIFEAV